MPKCINNIIDTNVSSGGNVNATSKSASNAYPSGTGTYINSPIKSNGDFQFADSFVDAVSDITLKLRNTDCTQTVVDYFNKQFPMLSAGAKKVYNWNTQSGLDSLGASYKNSAAGKITDQFCDFATNITRTLMFYIDMAAKSAFVLFKKIDALKNKIEKALLEFTSAVRDCLVSVIVDAKNAINHMLRNTLDFTSVLELMRHCPCVTRIIANLFNCKEDDNGNKLTTPDEVLGCVLNKFMLDPSKLINMVNNFIDNTILSTLNKVFNTMDEFIKTTMELLMTPFRTLIRLYAKLLTTKINVTPIIRTMSGFACLIVYTKEYNKKGEAYDGMSILDMISTLKGLANCLEFACSSYTDDMATKIKELNEKLRLDDRYWRDVMAIDIYQSAVGAKVQSNQPRPAMIRELFVKNQDKGKNVFIGVIDAFKQVGKVTYDAGVSGKTIGETAQAVKFKDGPENELTSATEPVNNNSKAINSSIENNIMSIEENLNSTDDPLYTEKFYELIGWISSYKRSAGHIKLIEKILKELQIPTDDYTNTHISTAYEQKGDRVYYQGVEVDPVIVNSPSYELENDYNQTSITKLSSYTPTPKTTQESMSEYYARWYTGALA